MHLKKKSRIIVATIAAMITAICCLNSQLQAQAQSAGQPTKQADQNANEQPAPNANQPYLLSSRMHLQMGTNKGYLVVRVEIVEGSYIYSLTQEGSPTKLSVTQSPKFRVAGEFSPDRPAEISTGTDGKQLEKHKSIIQFFAPIEVAPDVELSSLTAEVIVNGQVCNANSCMPIMSKKISGKFAGYFRGKSEEAGGAGSARSANAQDQPSSSGSNADRLQR